MVIASERERGTDRQTERQTSSSTLFYNNLRYEADTFCPDLCSLRETVGGYESACNKFMAQPLDLFILKWFPGGGLGEGRAQQGC